MRNLVSDLQSFRRVLGGLALAGILTLGVAGGISAQDDETSAAGNGGTSSASASGGAVSFGTVDSGESAGSALGVSIAEEVLAAIFGESSDDE